MSDTTSFTGKVPFGNKVAFGIGMLANQMFPAVLGIFMVVLVQDLGFPGWMWGILFFLPRVFDSITDPIMGFISDNTKSKWGRRRQYVFFGALLMGIAFVVMWQLYRENGVDYNFYYFLSFSFLFYLGLTIFSVPYVAMGYEMTEDFHERTSIMAVAQWIGQWAWVIAPWFWVIMYDQNWFPSADVATRTLAVWVGVICMLFAMVPAIFLKSKSTVNENYSPLTMKTIGKSLWEILENFKEAFRIPQFVKLCVSTFFIFNAFNTIAAFSFFIIVYHLFSGDAGAAGVWPTLFGSLASLVTTFVVIPTVAWMSRQMGKKRAFILSQSISIIGYLMLWFLFVPGKPWMFIFALPFFSFGIGSLFTLMMSMTADVMDLDELNSGKRREGVFGAIYWWMVKFGFAIAGLLSGVIMTVVGFDPTAAVQPENAVTGLRIFYSGLPILGTTIAIVMMLKYDITEEKANEIRAALNKRKEPREPEIIPSSSMTDRLHAMRDIAANAPLVDDLDLAMKSENELKEMFKKTLNSGMHGLCFSPYLENQQIGDVLSEEQIHRRMDIIKGHTKWVRSFSCTDGNERIPGLARQNGLKTMVGAWLGKNEEQNGREIKALIDLAREGYVDIAAVGNEVLLRGDLSLEEVLGYITQVKEALPGIPVGFVDTYYQFHDHPELTEACDVILANCYPFWEGCHIDDASKYLQQMHYIAVQAAKGKPVIITETGWPTKGEPTKGAEPSLENTMKFFLNLDNWCKKAKVDVFYFSSFDESWKIHHEGEVGQRWGLWDKNENLKFN
jgi:GPH family glycoside/pentoside/hexuronide:cation symporter